MVSVIPRGVDEGTAIIVAPAKALGHAHMMAIWSGRGNGLSLSALGGRGSQLRAVSVSGRQKTANNSKNSLLWLAVLRCYSASAVAEDPAFPRLKTIRWLLFRD